MDNIISVRKGLEKDSETLIEFNRAMALETEGKELPLNVVKPGVEKFFEHPEYGFYVVAENEGKIVGSLMITYEWSDWRNGLFWWIQSVYVKPEFRRQGVYSNLHNYVKDLARERGNVCGLRLYTEKRNVTAHKTYKTLGMCESNYIMFEKII